MRFLNLLKTLTLATLVSARRKVFIDNDGLEALHVMLPLLGDMEIVGISASFGDPSFVDALGIAYGVLRNTSLTECMSLYGGASTPLLRTKETFEIWQDLYGEFVWKGAWDPEYADSYTAADAQYDEDTPAAIALINAVRKNPGEVDVYAAGLMTTIAQAISMYPKLAEEAKSLWIMGGFIDGQYAQATGGDLIDDLNTDFNLMFDPEASHIVLTANWSDIYIGGNVTNGIYPPQSLLDELIDEFGMQNLSSNPKLSAIHAFVGDGNASAVTLPLWDATVSGFMAFPDLITHTTDVRISVDTSFASPFYGNLRIWSSSLAPAKSKTGRAKIVDTVNVDGLMDKIKEALSYDWSQYCTTHGPVSF